MEKKTYFISYTNRTEADKQAAVWLEWVLRNKGHKTIMQEYDSPYGGNFKMFMHNALKEADCVIAVLSHKYMESLNCTEEWINAKQFIPVRFDDCEPEGLLTHRAYIDLYKLEKNAAKKRFLEGLTLTKRPDEEPDYPIFADTAAETLPEPDFPLFPALPPNKLPEKNPHFTGRDAILEDIHRRFQAGQARQVVAGLGGVGKTQTAIEYAQRFGHEYKDAIWWVDAEESVKADLWEFAVTVGLIPEGADAAAQIKDEDFIRRLNGWYSSHKSFLLIFDNVEAAADIAPYIERATGGHVLITARDRKLGLVAHNEVIELDVFNAEEAQAFMREMLPARAIDDDKLLDRLIEELGRLPLALEQAAAYMADGDNNCGCKEYLMSLAEPGLVVLDGDTTKPEDYRKFVTKTWLITFKKLNEPAQQLLYLCAYMAPDSIPLDFFIQQRLALPKPLCDELKNMAVANKVIQSLTKYALAKRTGDFLNIHRLVQAVVRDGLVGDTKWIACCLNVACAVFDYEWSDKQSMDAFAQNVPHVLAIADYAEGLLKNDEEAQKKTARLYHVAGYGLDSNGQYKEALEWYNKALAIHEEVLGKEHPHTASIYNNIAIVCTRQCDYDKALEWYKKALSIREKVLGEEHPDTSDTYNNIAIVYKNQGNNKKALEWYCKALAIDEKVLDKEHPDTAATYNNIAIVYYRQGEYENALEWNNKALVIREKVLGKEHLDTADTYNNIANVHYSQDDYEKALEWHNKALTIREKVLGKEHPDTAQTYNNIATVYKNQGEYKEALKWYKKSYVVFLLRLGDEHPLTIQCKKNMAAAYKKAGRTEPFEQWLTQLALSVKLEAGG